MTAKVAAKTPTESDQVVQRSRSTAITRRRAGGTFVGFCGTLGLMATAHPAAALTCGLERRSVKTGTDPDAAAIHVHESTATTVDELVAIPAPASPPENRRVPPIETTVFVVDAQ